MTRTERPTD